MLVITPLKTAKECFDTLKNNYEKKDPSQKRALNNKLHNLNMEKSETMDSFFTNFSQEIDKLTSIRVVVDDNDHIQTVVNGISSSWEIFLAIVNGR